MTNELTIKFDEKSSKYLNDNLFNENNKKLFNKKMNKFLYILFHELNNK